MTDTQEAESARVHPPRAERYHLYETGFDWVPHDCLGATTVKESRLWGVE